MNSRAEVGLDFEFGSGTNSAFDFVMSSDSQLAVVLDLRLEQVLLVPGIREQQNSQRV